MSAGDWLAATGAVMLAVMLGGLLFALGSVVVTLRDLRATVEPSRRRASPWPTRCGSRCATRRTRSTGSARC